MRGLGGLAGALVLGRRLVVGLPGDDRDGTASPGGTATVTVVAPSAQPLPLHERARSLRHRPIFNCVLAGTRGLVPLGLGEPRSSSDCSLPDPVRSESSSSGMFGSNAATTERRMAFLPGLARTSARQ